MLVPGSGFPLDDDDQGVIQQRKVELIPFGKHFECYI